MPLNVLSLFDGISCGQLALRAAKAEVGAYFASEVDKHAISVTQSRFPSTTQLGDVRGVSGADLPKIDLLLGGSPCQGFSFAGKQLNFDDPRSALFFEFVRVMREVKPLYFLLENVKMKSACADVISEALGVRPTLINSSLVSAQNRERLYWTNLDFGGPPDDKGVALRDILEDRENWPEGPRIKGISVLRNIYPSGGQNGSVYSVYGKSKTLSAGTGIRGNGVGSSNAPKIEALNEAGWRRLSVLECERLQTVPDGYTAGPSDTQRYKMLGNCWTVEVVAHILCKGLEKASGRT